MIRLSPDAMSYKCIVELYARKGVHCETATLIFGKDIPRYIQQACDEARARYLKQGKDDAI